MVVLHDVTVRFGAGVALEVEELALHGGELVGVMGPNGAGKTTLLRLLAGTLQPTNGRIDDRPDRVAYVRQHPEQHSWMPMTAREIVNAGRYQHTGLLGRFRSGDHDRVRAAAARLEIQTLLDRPFRDLSGGQRQRVLIASAIASDAPCLLMDEPISGLDLPSQDIITMVAQEERDRGRLVVMTTHHVEEAQHCDRVVLLSSRVVADGPPAKILTPEPLAQAFGRRMVRLPSAARGDALLVDDHGHVS